MIMKIEYLIVFKLSQGEYVAAAYLEGIYLSCPAVNQIYIHQNSHKSYLIAIVVPNVQLLQKIQLEKVVYTINSISLIQRTGNWM